MEPNARDLLRRGVRAAVYRACWRRLDGDESGAQALLSCELPAVLSRSTDSAASDEALVRTWLDEDTADFDRAVLISDLVARRAAGTVAAFPLASDSPVFHAPVAEPKRIITPSPAPASSARAGSPAIADLLDGMLEQERRSRAKS